MTLSPFPPPSLDELRGFGQYLPEAPPGRPMSEDGSVPETFRPHRRMCVTNLTGLT